MPEPYIGKDVLSLNEMSGIHTLLNAVNDLLVDWEGEEVQVSLLTLNVSDRQGVHLGAMTKWTRAEDIKFEPNYKVE